MNSCEASDSLLHCYLETAMASHLSALLKMIRFCIKKSLMPTEIFSEMKSVLGDLHLHLLQSENGLLTLNVVITSFEDDRLK